MNTSKWKWVYNLMNHEVLEMDSVHGLPVSSLPVYGKVDWINNEDVTGKFVVYQKDHAIPIKKEEPIVVDKEIELQDGKRLKLLSNSELTQRVDSFMKGKYLYESLMKIGFEKWAQHLKKEFCDKTGIVKIEGYAEPTQPKKDISDKELEELLAKQRAMCADAFWNNRFSFMDKITPKQCKEMMLCIENYDAPTLASSIPIIDKGENAIEFGKFLHTNYAPTHSLKWVKRNIDGELLTTKELYQLFKSQK